MAAVKVTETETEQGTEWASQARSALPLTPVINGVSQSLADGDAPLIRRPIGLNGSPGSATPARPYVSQVHFHVMGRFGLPVECRPGLGLAFYPSGVLVAGVERCALRVDPARSLVRAGLQLI